MRHLRRALGLIAGIGAMLLLCEGGLPSVRRALSPLRGIQNSVSLSLRALARSLGTFMEASTFWRCGAHVE